MSWTTPVTDRAASDITGRTAKGFFNVLDWTRIDGNTAEVEGQILTLFALDVVLEDLTPPTVTVFPTAASINALVENIERVRVGACLPAGVGLVDLKTDWQPGNGAAAPNYANVNEWEENLDLLHTLIPNAAEYKVYCGVAETGQARFYQHRWR